MRMVNARTFQFRARRLVAGEYLARVVPFGWCEVLELSAKDGRTHVNVPPPCEVVLRFRDADGGEPVVPRNVSWTMPAAETDHALDLLSPDDDGAFRFTAPAATILVRWAHEGWTKDEREIECEAPRTVVTLPMRREAGCELYLFEDGEARTPWPFGLLPELEALDAGGAPAYLRGNRYAVRAPGRYRIALPALPGFEPVPPQDVVVGAGEWTRVEFRLRRRR